MKLLFAFLTCIASVLLIHAQQTVIHAGTLIDGVTDKASTEMTLIIKGGLIQEVIKGYSPPDPNDQYIDLKSATVMPGWIDLHVHMEGDPGPDSYLKEFQLNPADKAFEAADIARRTLMAGFTTVRDVGGTGVNVALKNAIKKGLVVGPRVFTAERSLAITGGHADPTNGYRDDLQGNPGPKMGVVNGTSDAYKAVRQRYKNGADLIKITATGGVLSVASDGTGAHFKEEEIAAIVSAATDLGFHVAAHAHGDEGMQRAIRAGVLTIEHGTYMSEETMDLMKQYKAFLIPTITAGKEVEEKAKIEGFYPDMVAKKALEVGPQILGTFAKAYKRGVPIAFGTDAGVFRHGDNAREFAYMVEGGMPEMKAIQCATSVAARVLSMEEELGQVKAGYVADLVATSKNPLEEIQATKNVVFVMKAGEIYKNLD